MFVEVYGTTNISAFKQVFAGSGRSNCARWLEVTQKISEVTFQSILDPLDIIQKPSAVEPLENGPGQSESSTTRLVCQRLSQKSGTLLHRGLLFKCEQGFQVEGLGAGSTRLNCLPWRRSWNTPLNATLALRGDPAWCKTRWGSPLAGIPAATRSTGWTSPEWPFAATLISRRR